MLNIKNTEEEMLKYDGDDKVISSFEAKEFFEKQAPPRFKARTKIPTLDKLMDRMDYGDLIIISGPTKNGKTAIAKTITKYFAEQEVNSLWFTYEVMPRDFLATFPELPLFYLPQKLSGNTLSWIESKIIEAKVKYDIGAVFIDHLHYLISLSASVNMSLMIGAVMRELKKMAIKHNVVIFIIAHTTKIKFDQTPEISDLRDSGMIACESDFVLMIWRLFKREGGENIYTNQAKIALLANRKTGNLGYLKVELVNNLFREYDEHREIQEFPNDLLEDGE